MVQRAHTHTHNRKPRYKLFKVTKNCVFLPFKACFLPTVSKCDVTEGLEFMLKSPFACRNFWIAYKEARSPGFFCLVWRRWFATGLPSPFPSRSSLRNYLILLAAHTWELSYSFPTSLLHSRLWVFFLCGLNILWISAFFLLMASGCIASYASFFICMTHLELFWNVTCWKLHWNRPDFN